MASPWRGIRSRAGLDNVRIHDLRHSFAMFGVSDVQTVGGLLGQDSLTATRIYAHLPDQTKRLASEHIGGVIAGHLLKQPVSGQAVIEWIEHWRQRVSKAKLAR